MAALDFPASPVNGQTYTANGKTWTFNSATSSWLATNPLPMIPISTGVSGLGANVAAALGETANAADGIVVLNSLLQLPAVDGSLLTGISSGAVTAASDTSTATARYPLFSSLTTGSVTTVYTSDPKYNYTPSVGRLTAYNVASSQGIVFNCNTITVDTTIPTGYNGSSAGPVAVSGGVTVTVSPGSRWVIV